MAFRPHDKLRLKLTAVRASSRQQLCCVAASDIWKEFAIPLQACSLAVAELGFGRRFGSRLLFRHVALSTMSNGTTSFIMRLSCRTSQARKAFGLPMGARLAGALPTRPTVGSADTMLDSSLENLLSMTS
ncbi:hypothetical protein PF003_g26366 [Phytophthora fragariae]|nr:hypothetical protein PF003_g26366 [Phytophthora fragariae]